jgi:hypothetical protein
MPVPKLPQRPLQAIQSRHAAALSTFNFLNDTQLLCAATGFDAAAAEELQDAALALLGSPLCTIRLTRWASNPYAVKYLERFV